MTILRRDFLKMAAITPFMPMVTRRTEPIIHVGILAGQSNSGERGVVAEVPQEQLHLMAQPANVRCFWWTETAPYFEERFFVDMPNFGFERIIANRWSVEHPNDELWILKTFVGGTGMDEWLPGQPGGLHARMVQTVLSLMMGQNAGLKWCVPTHGEADSWSIPWGNEYLTNLKLWIAHLRVGTGFPFVKIIVNMLGDPYPDRCRYHAVKCAQAMATLPEHGRLTYAVPTDGLPKVEPELLHYTTEGVLALGELDAEKILQFA